MAITIMEACFNLSIQFMKVETVKKEYGKKLYITNHLILKTTQYMKLKETLNYEEQRGCSIQSKIMSSVINQLDQCWSRPVFSVARILRRVADIKSEEKEIIDNIFQWKAAMGIPVSTNTL